MVSETRECVYVYVCVCVYVCVFERETCVLIARSIAVDPFRIHQRATQLRSDSYVAPPPPPTPVSDEDDDAPESRFDGRRECC